MAKAKKKKPTLKKTVKKTVKKAAKKPTPKVAAKAAKKAVPKKVTPKKSKAAPVKASAPAKRIDLEKFFAPLDDRVIVQISSQDRKTAGGLFIPDTVADVSGNLQGRVVLIGRGHLDQKGRIRSMDVKPGDRVVFSEFSGSKIRLMNEDYVILRENEVMGILS